MHGGYGIRKAKKNPASVYFPAETDGNNLQRWSSENQNNPCFFFVKMVPLLYAR